MHNVKYTADPFPVWLLRITGMNGFSFEDYPHVVMVPGMFELFRYSHHIWY